MTDLATTWLGLELTNPIVASSSPMTADLDHLIALEAAGVGAVILPSLFEEQLTAESLAVHDYLEAGVGMFAEATGGLAPELDDYNTGPGRYLRHLEKAKSRLQVPVIASMNGDTSGGWIHYARMLADAGADALELNVYRIAGDTSVTGGRVEDELVDLVGSVCQEVEVPVAVKLGPWFSSLANLAHRLAGSGASGLDLFNRFYQPDIDVETLTVVPELTLSHPSELRLPLRWTAMLHGRVETDLGITSGVHTWREVAKGLLAGAQVTMMASALLREGVGALSSAITGLQAWMLEMGYASVDQLRGSMSQVNVTDPASYERANYLETLTTWANTFRG